VSQVIVAEFTVMLEPATAVIIGGVASTAPATDTVAEALDVGLATLFAVTR
jgi:hypothetical protein